MRVGVISVFTDYHRRGRHHRGVLQPQIGPLVAALLPPDVEVDVVNDTWEDPDWSRDYDLVFLSALHSDFDRARQISHYYRRRGAATVLGGPLASTFPQLCAPWFDAVAVGDPESTVPAIHRDFAAGELKTLYRAERYQPQAVPVPRLDLVATKQVLPLALEATRGCPFTCDFCTLTGLGTRYHTRAAATIAAHLREAQALLAGRVARWKQRLAVFYDNNVGGSPVFLRALCDALAPLGIRWGGCITFNILRDTSMLDRLAASGCRLVYFGLETFNPAALADMGKHQNLLAETRTVIDACRARGILATAGLMLSPTMDTLEYIDRIPEFLDDCGLHVPTYICFETPFPGTPHFKRLADDAGADPPAECAAPRSERLHPRHAAAARLARGVRRRLPPDAPRRLLAGGEAAQARGRSRAVPAAGLSRAGGVRPLRDARGRAAAAGRPHLPRRHREAAARDGAARRRRFRERGRARCGPRAVGGDRRRRADAAAMARGTDGVSSEGAGRATTGFRSHGREPPRAAGRGARAAGVTTR